LARLKADLQKIQAQGAEREAQLAAQAAQREAQLATQAAEREAQLAAELQRSKAATQQIQAELQQSN
jgi:hypothetical protein